MLDSLTIHDITKEQYLATAKLVQDQRLEPNGALAIDIMRQNNVTEIYTYDENFTNIQEITKLPKL
jgi:predicted nucleic acid-binding protein